MEFMFRTAAQAWQALGSRRFMTLQFKQNLKELETTLKPDGLRKFDVALKVATGKGTKRAAKEMYLGFTEYTDNVRASRIPTLVLHGELDGAFSISAIRAFADDLPDKVKLISMEDGYGPTLSTHVNEVLGRLRALFRINRKSSQFSTYAVCTNFVKLLSAYHSTMSGQR